MTFFIQNWYSNVNESTRAKSYALYSNFQLQPYLNNINIDKFRIALSRLRLSAHRLEIETGRWRSPKIPIHDRKC